MLLMTCGVAVGMVLLTLGRDLPHAALARAAWVATVSG